MRKARVANAKAQSATTRRLAAETGAPTDDWWNSCSRASGSDRRGSSCGRQHRTTNVDRDHAGYGPEAVRKARVANAKAEAAYNKVLKAGRATAVPAPRRLVVAPAASRCCALLRRRRWALRRLTH